MTKLTIRRIRLFYYRFLNQYRIHRGHLPLWDVIRIAWKQSRKRSLDIGYEPTIKPMINKKGKENKTKGRFYCPDCAAEYAIAFGYRKLGDPIHCDRCGGDNVIDRAIIKTNES